MECNDVILCSFQSRTIVSLCDASSGRDDAAPDCSQKSNEIYSQTLTDGWVEYKYRIIFNPNPPNPKHKDFVVISAASFTRHHYKQLLYVTEKGKTRTYLTKIEEAEVVDILAWTKENYIYYISTLPKQPGSRHIFRILSPTVAVHARWANSGLPECLTCSSHQDEATSQFTVPPKQIDHMDYLSREPCNYFTADFSNRKVI